MIVKCISCDLREKLTAKEGFSAPNSTWKIFDTVCMQNTLFSLCK